MPKPEFKKPENVHVRQPAVEGLDDLFTETPPPIAPEPASRWAPIPAIDFDDAPRAPHDGVPVFLLSPDGHTEVAAVWRRTRAYVQTPKSERGFRTTGFWVQRHQETIRIPWAPVGWRPYEEPVVTPAKRRQTA